MLVGMVDKKIMHMTINETISIGFRSPELVDVLMDEVYYYMCVCVYTFIE